MASQPALATVPISHCEYTVQTAARAALRGAGYRALAELECHVENGSLVLSGTVSSYYLKQVAQSVVLRLARDWRLNNCVNVRGQ
jgi:hypothetical protein